MSRLWRIAAPAMVTVVGIGGAGTGFWTWYSAVSQHHSHIELQAKRWSAVRDAAQPGHLDEVVEVSATDHGSKTSGDLRFWLYDTSREWDGNPLTLDDPVGPAGQCAVQADGSYVDCGPIGAGETYTTVLHYHLNWGDQGTGHLAHEHVGNSKPHHFYPGSVTKWSEGIHG